MAATTVVTMVTCATLMMMTLLSSCVVVNARPVEKTHQKPLDVYIFDSKVPVTIANEIMKLQQAANFKGSTIPKQFLLYDRNHDWRVSLEELAFATSTKLSDAREPFSAADLNRKFPSISLSFSVRRLGQVQ